MKAKELTNIVDARAYGYQSGGAVSEGEKWPGQNLMDPVTGRMSDDFLNWAERIFKGPVLALQSGLPVAFPTETVYGLGADISCPAAVAKIYELKGRPDDNPLIVHVPCRVAIKPLVKSLSPQAEALAAAFMPGPLTLVLPRSPLVPDIVTAGLDTVGIRIPASLPARAFLALSGRAVAAPSANLSGSPSPTTADHVEADFAGRLSYIIDGGPAEVGLESTVLDVTGPVPLILRPGKITAEAVISCLEKAGVTPEQADWKNLVTESERSRPEPAKAGEPPRAPGMKYRHYAPSVPVEIIPCAAIDMRAKRLLLRLNELLEQAESAYDKNALSKKGGDLGKVAVSDLGGGERAARSDLAADRPFRIGLFAGAALLSALPPEMPVVSYCYGDQDDPEQAARALFAGLRSLDRSGVALILAEAMPLEGVGTAYMNRLNKAAAG